MQPLKDKRTKEQILKLLDHAMEQEERLGTKIKTLETELAECRKKVEDPRHELTEEALPASKVSFRIDYYRTSDKSPLKGIIEHLPSRQTKSFEGEEPEAIVQFMSHFLHEETGKMKKKKPDPAKTPESKASASHPENGSGTGFPDQENAAGAEATQQEPLNLTTAEYDALFGDAKAAETPLPPLPSPETPKLKAAEPLPAQTPKVPETKHSAEDAADTEPGSRLLKRLKSRLGAETPPESMPVESMPVENASTAPGSRLLRKLKSRVSTETPQDMPPAITPEPSDTAASAPPPSRSPHVERLLAKFSAQPETEQVRKTPPPPPRKEKVEVEQSRPKLLQRLREEYQESLNSSARN